MFFTFIIHRLKELQKPCLSHAKQEFSSNKIGIFLFFMKEIDLWKIYILKFAAILNSVASAMYGISQQPQVLTKTVKIDQSKGIPESGIQE